MHTYFHVPATQDVELNGKDLAVDRRLEKLRRDLGPGFMGALNDPDTIEILLNADGTLWQEKLGGHMQPIGRMSAARAEAVMRTIASCLHTVITWHHPTIEGELSLDGSRFAGQLPPIVSAPTFAVRKKASSVFTLDQYVEQRIMTPEQKDVLCQAIAGHRNILVIGGTASGNTTLTNGLIHEMTGIFPHERIVIIEDTGEIQCSARTATASEKKNASRQFCLVNPLIRKTKG